MIEENFDTKFWQNKFDRTGGYTVLKERFSMMDVCNARFRYARDGDTHFPITFTDLDHSIIRNTIKEGMGKRRFWAAVVAPTQAFFDGDWYEWEPRGEAFMEMQLCRLVVDRDTLKKLPKKHRQNVKMDAINHLIKAGLIRQEVDYPVIIPKKLKVRTDWDPTPAPTEEDVLDALEDFDA